jgi:hypothetical protein
MWSATGWLAGSMAAICEIEATVSRLKDSVELSAAQLGFVDIALQTSCHSCLQLSACDF